MASAVERRVEEVAVVLAIGHALGAHEALGRPDALSGFLEVVHRLFGGQCLYACRRCAEVTT